MGQQESFFFVMDHQASCLSFFDTWEHGTAEEIAEHAGISKSKAIMILSDLVDRGVLRTGFVFWGGTKETIWYLSP